MNAGAKNPAGSRSLAIAAPFRFQKAVPRTKEKRRGEAPIGAPVRVMGRLFPSAEGTGFAARRPTGAAIRTSACRRFAPLGLGDIPQKRPGASSPGAMEFGFMKSEEHQACGMRAFSTGQLATSLSCPAKAGHPVLMVWQLLDHPLSRVMTAEDRSSCEHFGETNPRPSAPKPWPKSRNPRIVSEQILWMV